MINSKDILARLQNGENAEAIANELITALNEANDLYTAAAKNQKKVTDMQDILDLLHDFCIEYYCNDSKDIDAVEEAFAELTAEKVIQMVEEAGETVALLEEHLKDIEKMFADKPFFGGVKPVEIEVDKNKAPADAIIGSFLSSLGLK